jgi:hypothetical protein|tara:strand:+ start:604 stop:735 length:132 start_codon:yes stop_codon:yes gene_type:complete
MNLGERVACIETKLKTIEKLLYILIAAMGIQVGSNVIPVVAAG